LKLVLLAGALIMVAALAWRAGPWTNDPVPGVTIAVLPLAQFSTLETDELLAARLTDGITTELARLGTVHVVSTTSARQFAGVRRPLREIAQALDADFIVEGSIEATGDSIQLSARIVDGATDQKIWVDDFNGSVSDLPALERNIARAISAAVAARRR
jgi:TolB-like protein